MLVNYKRLHLQVKRDQLNRPWPYIIKLFCPQFTNFRNKLDCLSLASFCKSFITLAPWVRSVRFGCTWHQKKGWGEEFGFFKTGVPF